MRELFRTPDEKARADSEQVFDAMARLAYDEIVGTGDMTIETSDIKNSYATRTLRSRDYSVPDGYEGGNNRIQIELSYQMWGGLEGDPARARERIDTIAVAFGSAARKLSNVGHDEYPEDITLNLSKSELGRKGSFDTRMLLATAIQAARASTRDHGKPSDRQMQALTDARIAEAYAAFTTADSLKLKTIDLAQHTTDGTAPEERGWRPYEAPENYTITTTTARDNTTRDLDDNADILRAAAQAPSKKTFVPPSMEIISNGYSVEQFLKDHNARKLPANSRDLVVALCVTQDKARTAGDDQIRFGSDVPRPNGMHVVRDTLTNIPISYDAEQTEILLTEKAYDAAFAEHPKWFERADDLKGRPRLYWVQNGKSGIEIGTNASRIAQFDLYGGGRGLVKPIGLRNQFRDGVLGKLDALFAKPPEPETPPPYEQRYARSERGRARY